MQALELKIPPPALAGLMAVAMWAVASSAPLVEVPAHIRSAVAVFIAVTGVGFDIAGIISFRAAATTINPMRPGSTTALVCSGIYKLSRNPMYLGVLFILVAWAVYLSSAWALIGPLAFLIYLNKFQVAPEERMLLTKFGAEYSAYKSMVRRWL